METTAPAEGKVYAASKDVARFYRRLVVFDAAIPTVPVLMCIGAAIYVHADAVVTPICCAVGIVASLFMASIGLRVYRGVTKTVARVSGTSIERRRGTAVETIRADQLRAIEVRTTRGGAVRWVKLKSSRRGNDIVLAGYADMDALASDVADAFAGAVPIEREPVRGSVSTPTAVLLLLLAACAALVQLLGQREIDLIMGTAWVAQGLYQLATHPSSRSWAGPGSRVDLLGWVWIAAAFLFFGQALR